MVVASAHNGSRGEDQQPGKDPNAFFARQPEPAEHNTRKTPNSNRRLSSRPLNVARIEAPNKSTARRKNSIPNYAQQGRAQSYGVPQEKREQNTGQEDRPYEPMSSPDEEDDRNAVEKRVRE